MLELLKKRRSIRKFQKQQIARMEIEQLIKAALLSPSSPISNLGSLSSSVIKICYKSCLSAKLMAVNF